MPFSEKPLTKYFSTFSFVTIACQDNLSFPGLRHAAQVFIVKCATGSVRSSAARLLAGGSGSEIGFESGSQTALNVKNTEKTPGAFLRPGDIHARP